MSGDRETTEREDRGGTGAEESIVKQNKTFYTRRLLTQLSAAENNESEKKPVI